MTEPTAVNPTDGEAAMLQNLFTRAANTIVEASTLRSEVQELSRKVQELSQEVDRLRESNRSLNEQLEYVRTERDELKSKLYEAEHNARTAESNFKMELNAHELTKGQLQEAKMRIVDLEVDLDRSEDHNRELDNKLFNARYVISAITEDLEGYQDGGTEQEAVPTTDPTPALHHSESSSTTSSEDTQPRDDKGKFQPFNPEDNWKTGTEY